MAIALVQSKVGTSGSNTTSRTITLDATSTAGNCLVIAIASGTQTLPTSVTDSAGNTYTKATAVQDVGGAGNRYNAIYYCLSAAAATSVTFTAATSIALMGTVYEFSGVGGVRASTSTYNNGSIQATITAGNGDAMVGCMSWTNGNATATINNPSNGDTWTNQAQGTIGTVYHATASVLGTTAGTRGPKFNTPGAVSYGISVLALYETVASATAVPTAVTANVGGWTNVGGAASVQAGLADSDDATYAQSDTATANPSKLRVRLGSLVTPTAFTLTVRAKLSASGAGTMYVRLFEGSTQRKQWTVTPTTSWADYALTLDSGEIATVTSWAALDVEYEWGV
jgi:hypothetical protein